MRRLSIALAALALGRGAAAVLLGRRQLPAPDLPPTFAPEGAISAGNETAASPELKHFLDGVPSLLRNSGERVGSAVQSMLEVQGSLDDLRDDLATEYKLWHAKKDQLVKERDAIGQQIREKEAELLAQKSARANAERLRAKLAAAVEDGNRLNATRDDARIRWSTAQAKLKAEIAEIEREIDTEREQRSVVINATHARTDKVLRLQSLLQNETLVKSAAVRSTEQARATTKLTFSRKQSSLLREAAATRGKIVGLNTELQDQSKLLAESRRLAGQASKVASQRHQLEAEATNCTEKLQRLSDEVVAVVQSANADTAELQKCQALDAKNQATKARINECRLARER